MSGLITVGVVLIVLAALFVGFYKFDDSEIDYDP